jgi:hypothetical protein|tara:strand:+ start:304 stop:1041 length:738 start_codon:yes stop_codon:yes gene_type:complete
MKKAIVFIFCFYSLSLLGQGKQNTLNTILFEYTHQFPFGDLAKDYGDNSSISMGYMEKTKQNWIFEIDGSYIFGYKIKSENLFDGIATKNEEIINKDGLFANVLTYERGFSIFLNGGKAFTFYEGNETGIYLFSGIGYMQHKIRIQTQEDIIPHLDDEYKKGYDRLSGGISAKFNANYMYFSKRNNVKLYAGLELTKGWTKNLRSYNFDEMSYTSANYRNDILVGIKAGVIIPIFKRNQEEFYYR